MEIMRQTRGNNTRILLLCGVLAPAILLLTIIVVGQISPNYNPVSDTISQMGVSSNPYAVALNSSYAIYGVLMCCAAYGFYLKLRHSTLAKNLAILIGIHAIGNVFLAAFPDSADYPGKTFTEDILHNSFSALVSIALLACILIFRKITRQEKSLQVVAMLGLVIILVSLPLPFINMIDSLKPFSGLLQRLIVSGSFSWIALASVFLMRSSPRVEAVPT